MQRKYILTKAVMQRDEVMGLEFILISVIFSTIVLDSGEGFLADRRWSFQFVIDFSTSRLALKLSVGAFTP